MSGAADLLAGWRAWRAARDVATVATAPEPVATAPNPQKTAIVASVATVAGESMPECVAPQPERAAPDPARLPLPRPDWRSLPYGAERGAGFADARQAPGACFCCAGRDWWRQEGEAPPGRCAACHPPPPGLAFTTTEARARNYQPGDPDPLRDGLLRGWRDHREAGR